MHSVLYTHYGNPVDVLRPTDADEPGQPGPGRCWLVSPRGRSTQATWSACAAATPPPIATDPHLERHWKASA
ncbi:hypothetical protein [Streptomyces bobili]|uniref:hypothetical protein n=1 Tax=Streptomyces bobili TaxID=67280 RepID=UPI0037A3EA2C